MRTPPWAAGRQAGGQLRRPEAQEPLVSLSQTLVLISQLSRSGDLGRRFIEPGWRVGTSFSDFGVMRLQTVLPRPRLLSEFLNSDSRRTASFFDTGLRGSVLSLDSDCSALLELSWHQLFQLSRETPRRQMLSFSKFRQRAGGIASLSLDA